MSSIEPSVPVTASSVSTQSAPALRQDIGAANARFMEAFRRADADGIAACYTPDGQLLPSNHDVIAGTAAIAGFWRAVIAAGIGEAQLETVEVEGRGDLAVEVGRYALAGADGGTLDQGKYVVVWHREGGGWKLHRDIWTTSLPQQQA